MSNSCSQLVPVSYSFAFLKSAWEYLQTGRAVGLVQLDDDVGFQFHLSRTPLWSELAIGVKSNSN